MAVFCFDDESEMGFHWSARTPHHFFVQLDPSWLNGCLQGFKFGVVTSWTISLQNRLERKVHGIRIRAWVSKFTQPDTLLNRSSSASLTSKGSRTAAGPEASSCVKNYLFSKVCISKGRTFSSTCSNKLGCWLSNPHQWTPNKICSRMM